MQRKNLYRAMLVSLLLPFAIAPTLVRAEDVVAPLPASHAIELDNHAWKLSLIAFSSGILLLTLAIVLYITRRNLRRYRKLAEEHRKNLHKLQESAQLWDAAINGLPVYFFIKDAGRDLQYLLTNQPWRDFLQRTSEEVQDKTDYAIFPHELAEEIRQNDQALIRGGVSREWTLPVRAPGDDAIHYLRVVRQPFTTLSGKRLLLGAALDITEAEQTKQHLEEAIQAAEAGNQAKNFFIASVSHEIRTPLNAVIGFSELLRDSEVDRKTQKEYLNAIVDSGNALLQLLNDVLDLSKLEAGPPEVTPEATDLADFCTRVVKLFISSAATKGVECRVECENIPVIHIDRQRLRQILFNVIGNAVKCTETGTVTVTGEFAAGENGLGTLALNVRDEGPEISGELQAHIFEPFWKSAIRGGTDQEEGDSGLGLAIAARMTEKLGGRISLADTSAAGTIFRLEFPDIAFDAPPADAARPLAVIPDSRDDAFTVLLVDDVLMNLKVLEAMLKRLKVKTMTAASGAEALKLLEQQRFDIIFTDVWMPELNGVQLAEAVQAMPECANIPLVAITADTESQNNFNMALFAAVLSKPVTLDQLEKVLPPRLKQEA